MNSKRLFFALIAAIIALGMGTATAVYMGNAYLKSKTEDLLTIKTESILLDDQQRSLIKAKQDLETYAELESIANTIVPKEKDQAITVRELIKFAEEAGIKIVNISFPSSDLGTPGSTKPATGATPTQKSITSQLEPILTIPGVYSLDITIKTAGEVPYSSLINFLEKLEQNRHTSQVNELTINTVGSSVTFDLTIRVYIKP